jgi:hypothetical protein
MVVVLKREAIKARWPKCAAALAFFDQCSPDSDTFTASDWTLAHSAMIASRSAVFLVQLEAAGMIPKFPGLAADATAFSLQR